MNCQICEEKILNINVAITRCNHHFHTSCIIGETDCPECNEPLKIPYKNVKKESIHKEVEWSDEILDFLQLEKQLYNRIEITKYFFDYIKKNNLINSESKRKFIVNEDLQKLFNILENEELTIFNMQKYLGLHIKK